MRRTTVLYAPAAAVVGAAWLSLEDAGRLRNEVLAASLLALGPALARGALSRGLSLALATVLAAGVAFDSPREAAGAWDGVLAFWDVNVPFSALEQPRMAGVVVLAVYAFALGLALAVDARRPLTAALVAVAGAGWPATLAGAGAARGGPLLAVVLLLLASGARRSPAWRGAILAGVVLVGVGLAGATSSALAKDELLRWKRWDPYDRPDEPVSVAYVWNANYGGIRFPDKATDVLTVEGVRRSLYWRATTLDTFDGLRWREELRFLSSSATGDARLDPLFPRRGRDPRRWLRARVTVRALRDRRLSAPSMPVRYESPQLPFLLLFQGGVASAGEPLRRGARYTVASYVPRPTPAQLTRVQAPAAGSPAGRYLELTPGITAPPWGTPGRRRAVLEQLAQPGPAGPMLPYRPLVDLAERIAGGRTSPYGAAVSVETWLRSQGGFRYEEQPEATPDVPPLVGFLTRTKEGYCQQFAGSMALMLRTLGIPARVAAGFTSGSYEPLEGRPRWIVTDRDAHAWVEVWFEGWGWLPFDPTPGRGQLGGSYSTSSATADVRGIQDAVRGGDGPNRGFDIQIAPVADPGGGGRRIGRVAGLGVFSLLLLAGAAALTAIGLAKLARRRWRYRVRNPRATAAACRAELVDFLADQGIRVPPSATATELAADVQAAFGLDATRFASALAEARYGPPGGAAAGARRARAELATLRRRLSEQLTRTERIRGLASLRSLGLAG